MPSCEMCGRDAPLRRAVVEGTLMSVCGSCVRFGVEQAGAHNEVTGRSRAVEGLERRSQRAKSRDIYSEMQEELIPDYGRVVREARIRKGFKTTEELGKQILERKNVLDQVEAGTLHPPDTLVKKLERALGIKLMEKPDAPVGVGGARPASGGSGFTLGDFIKKQPRKKD